ncbi:MAG: response regulator [Steroidobacter sp.]
MMMFELLRLQAQTQAQLLTNCVMELARDPFAPEQLNACAAAACSFERTAQMVGLEAGAELARTLEECLAAARRGEIELQQELLSLMLQSVDLLDNMSRLPTAAQLFPESETPEDSQPRSKCKPVLVVADSADTRELEHKLLRFRGYEVVAVENGIDAWYEVLSGKYGLVLTDVDLPGLDGIQLIRLIRNDPRFARLPILIACELEDPQQRWRGFDAGANYYVIKGTFHDTLVEAVSTLIGPAEV